MLDWWSETDSAILDCLRSAGAISPSDLGRRVGISEGEATAFLCMLARQGKVAIRLVELKEEPTGGTLPAGDGPVTSEPAGLAMVLPARAPRAHA